MKLIRKLIVFLVSLLMTFILVFGILFVLTYDDSKNPYDKTKEYNDIVNIIGKSTYDSIEAIKLNNYKEDKNNITLSITDDDLNHYVYKMIKENVNKNYLETEDYIIKKGSTTLQSIYFSIIDSNIHLSVRIDNGIYKTIVMLTGEINIENRYLNIKLKATNLGKIPAPLEVMKAFLATANLNYGNTIQFDVDNLIFKINLEEVFKKDNDSFMSILLNSADIKSVTSDKKIDIILDTKDIFLKEQVIPSCSKGNLDEQKENAKIEAMANSFNYSIDISEESLNYLIVDNLGDSLNKFNKEFKIGDKNFKLKIKDNEVFYDIKESKIYSNIYLNDASIPLVITIEPIYNMESDYITSISFDVKEVKLGNVISNNIDLFDIDDIPSADLGLENVNIKEIKLNKETNSITINGIYEL